MKTDTDYNPDPPEPPQVPAPERVRLARVDLIPPVARGICRVSTARSPARGGGFDHPLSLCTRRSARWKASTITAISGRLRPYNQTLFSMSAPERRRWASRVMEQLRARCRTGTRVTILAGARYRQYLEPQLKQAGYAVRVPLAGMFIGQQKRWLRQARRRQ